MSRLGSRRNFLALLSGIAAFGVGLWLWRASDSDEAVLRVVNEVLDAARVTPGEMPGRRDQRLQEVVDSHFEDPVTIRQADLPRTGVGRRALLTWGRLLQSYSEARLTAEQVQVGLSDGKRAATVRLAVVLNAVKKDETIAERRSVELRLRRKEGAWRIQRVDVETALNDVPEARP